ncbi:Glutaredoxin domain-containing protein [Psidium guajava]|nr:Glutaredoxin domain-containing protein [Psidium guajava]
MCTVISIGYLPICIKVIEEATRTSTHLPFGGVTVCFLNEGLECLFSCSCQDYLSSATGLDVIPEFMDNVWCIKILSPQEVQQMGKRGSELLNSVPDQRLSNGNLPVEGSRRNQVKSLHVQDDQSKKKMEGASSCSGSQLIRKQEGSSSSVPWSGRQTSSPKCQASLVVYSST